MVNKIKVCISVVSHVLQIWYSWQPPMFLFQSTICCCVKSAPCPTWCDGTKATLMMVDSRKGQQVVQLVGCMLGREEHHKEECFHAPG